MEAAMKSYTKEERQEHLENWKKGKLSKTAYAKSAGIVATTFYKWVQDEEKGKQGFVEIRKGKLLNNIQEIAIEKGDVIVRVPLTAGIEGMQIVMRSLGALK